jgi:hypothetical protein
LETPLIRREGRSLRPPFFLDHPPSGSDNGRDGWIGARFGLGSVWNYPRFQREISHVLDVPVRITVQADNGRFLYPVAWAAGCPLSPSSELLAGETLTSSSGKCSLFEPIVQVVTRAFCNLQVQLDAWFQLLLVYRGIDRREYAKPIRKFCES